jgi:hypothetical protein
MVDAGQEPFEQVGAVSLVVVGGVVTLALQGGPELDAGLEEGAGLADGFEGVDLPVLVAANRPAALDEEPAEVLRRRHTGQRLCRADTSLGNPSLVVRHLARNNAGR